MIILLFPLIVCQKLSLFFGLICFCSGTNERITYLCSKIVTSTSNSYYSTLNQKTYKGGSKSNGWSKYFLAPRGPKGWTIPPSRGYGMIVARVLRGALKLRYILLGGAIGGGVTLNKVSNCLSFLMWFFTFTSTISLIFMFFLV